MKTIQALLAFLFALFLLVLSPGSALAQNTVIVSPTTKPIWNPSPDDSATFGTPAVPILTSYQARLYPRTAVSGTTEPTAVTPTLVLDFGKPVVDASNNQTGPLLKPLITAGTEFVLFLHAVGPGGASPSGAVSAPFGFPSAPRSATAVVGFTP